MDKIRNGVGNVYGKELTGSRPRIPVSVSGVWDCFGGEAFTSDLHFTVGINIVDGITISLTVPNAAKKRWRQLGNICQDAELRDKFSAVLRALSSNFPEFWIGLVQRHFIGMTRDVRDARLDFKFETFRQGRQKGGTKFFPLWYETFLSALQSSRRGNFQLQFSARFPYKYEKTKTPEFANVALETIKAFKPLYTMIKR
jgi:hypothetical protein